MSEKKIVTVEDVKDEINQLVNSLVGKINSFDNKRDVQDTTQRVLTDVLAKADLSKLEKAGIMAFVLNRRVQ